MSEVAPGAYDPVELRRRIAVCFSVGELRALAESLGVGGVAWERGIDEAAREVVRQCERYAGLPALVARLRETRPLVEWPEPAAGPPIAPNAFVGGPPATLEPQPGPAPPLLSTSPGTLGGPAAPAPVRDPYAPQPGSPLADARAPARAAAWPGTTPEPAAPGPRGIDPRVLIAVAALMLVAAIVAYLAGKASSPPASAAAAPSASAAAAPPRGDGPAAHAADAIAHGLANLARTCELPASAGGNELVFRRVFERCGSAAPTRRPGQPAPVASDATDTPPPSDPGATHGARGGRGDATPAAPAPAKGCVGTCDAQHAACRSRCGPEPTESSAYGAYQHCLGRCLSDASRCRLSCH